jgi:lysophospholipase L1-like esterase
MLKMRLVALAALVSLVAGCGIINHANPASPDSVTVNTVNYTAVGASDAIGYGSSVVCVPYTDCPNGMGYVQVMTRHFKNDGKTTTLLNLGIPGAVLSPDIENLGNSLNRGIYANFLDSEGPFISKDATVITMFAGGNDANTIAAAMQAGLGGSDPSSYEVTLTQNWGRDMKKLFDTAKQRAPQARVVALNLPNLAALPYAAGLSLGDKRTLQDISVRLSAQVNALTSSGALIIDLMCDGGFYNTALYSSDGFHPNDAGYQRLADIVYPVASTGAASAPKGTCSSMSMF